MSVYVGEWGGRGECWWTHLPTQWSWLSSPAVAGLHVFLTGMTFRRTLFISRLPEIWASKGFKHTTDHRNPCILLAPRKYGPDTMSPGFHMLCQCWPLYPCTWPISRHIAWVEPADKQHWIFLLGCHSAQAGPDLTIPLCGSWSWKIWT